MGNKGNLQECEELSYMKNLGGVSDCDKVICVELALAGVPTIELLGRMDSSVPARVIGLLNGFVFQRAWSYWIVEGYLPLQYAELLHTNYNHLQIRVNGEGESVAPSSRSHSKDYKATCITHVNRMVCGEITFEDLASVSEDLLSSDKEKEQFVHTYHIDTQEGLNKFVEIIKEHSITA